VQVHVPVGDNPRSSTNDTTWVRIDLLMEGGTLCESRDHGMIWCLPMQQQIVRDVHCDVLSLAEHGLRSALLCARQHGWKQRTHFQAKVDLSTCRTTVQNIGPVTFVIAHVLGHLSRSIVLLLFLQKQNLVTSIYLFGLGTLLTGLGLKDMRIRLTMTSPVHW